MSSYLKSECYRLLRYSWTYLFIGLCTILLLSANIVLAAVKHVDSSFQWATTYFSFSNVYSSLAMVFILCIAVSNMIFGNETNNHTMKNTVSYGISRGTIYFGKLIVQIVYALVAFVVIVGVYVLSAYLLLENSGPNELEILIRSCLASLPLLIVGLAIANCFIFMIEGSGAIAAAAGMMIAVPLVCNMLGMKFKIFQELGMLLPWNILNSIEVNQVKKDLEMYWSTSDGFRNCYLIGAFEIILFALIGYVVFRKKEIK